MWSLKVGGSVRILCKVSPRHNLLIYRPAIRNCFFFFQARFSLSLRPPNLKAPLRCLRSGSQLFYSIFWQGLKGGTGEKGEKVGTVNELIDDRF